jgi:hypothetical protein
MDLTCSSVAGGVGQSAQIVRRLPSRWSGRPTALSGDLLSIDPEAIMDIEIAMTIVGGMVLYER